MAVITNLRFADGVDALAEEELKLEAEATKLREIKVKEQKLDRVTRFKYHTAVVLHDGFKPKVFSWIAQAT